MTTQRDLERALDAFFVHGADEVADRVIDDALVTIEQTPQRRVLRLPRRSDIMTPFARLAVAAAAIVIVAGGGFYLLSPGNQGVGGPPATPPSPSIGPADPSGSPAASTAAITDWQTVTSDRFGYRVDIPADWGESPPTNDLPPDSFPGDPAQYANRWDAPQTRSPSIVIAVRDPEPGESVADWLARTQSVFAADCGGTAPVELTVNGDPAIRSSWTCLTVKAAVFVQWSHDGKAYTIVVSGSAGDQANLDAIMDMAVSSFRFTAS